MRLAFSFRVNRCTFPLVCLKKRVTFLQNNKLMFDIETVICTTEKFSTKMNYIELNGTVWEIVFRERCFIR